MTKISSLELVYNSEIGRALNIWNDCAHTFQSGTAIVIDTLPTGVAEIEFLTINH